MWYREIHTSDLRRAHDSNIDFKEGDRTKIHWGKFALMGRLVNNVTTFQNRCRTSVGLNFIERPQLHHQLFSPHLVLMDPIVSIALFWRALRFPLLPCAASLPSLS